MTGLSRRFVERLGEPADASGLAFFRAVIGTIVAVSAVRFLAYGWVDELFVRPRFFFTYPGFEWVRPPPPGIVHEVFVAMAVLGVAVALGLAHRIATVALLILFVWIQLADVTNYLNHYVLVALLLAQLALMPLGRAGSLGTWLRPHTRLATLPLGLTWLLRFQVGCVYVFAGKAKLGVDWLLHAQPLGIWLGSRTDLPVLGSLFAERWIAYAFSWAGFLFDATIVLFLCLRRTRALAYAVVVVFHTITGLLFPIGMFPVIMVAAATIFFPPDWPRRLVGRMTRRPVPEVHGERVHVPRWKIAAGMAWVALNLALPLRADLLGGDVRWHERGMRLSWRVMVREKNAVATYHLEDRATGRRWFVRPREWLDDRQEREFATQPDLVWQLGRAIARDEASRGRDVAVRAEVLASLNGRPPRPLVDAEMDLTRIERDELGRWILPAPTEPPARAGRRGRW